VIAGIADKVGLVFRRGVLSYSFRLIDKRLCFFQTSLDINNCGEDC